MLNSNKQYIPKHVSLVEMTASPKGTVVCPVTEEIIRGK